MSVQLNTITWGDGARSALLLHGITSNAAGWWRLGPAVADLGYTVVAADMRGHGLSPKDDDYRFTTHAEDVLELRDEWDVVIGHSMGAAVSLIAQTARPTWADKLILEDPALLLPNREFATAWLLQDFLSGADAESLAAANPAWAPQDAQTKAEALEQCGPEVVVETLLQNDPWDVRALVAGIEVPVHLIGADPEGGALLPPAFGEELAVANPAVTYTQVKGSHSMHRDRWDDFWAVVSPLL